MTRIAVLIALAALAACGTPEERCLRRATPDYSTIDAEIAETEANIARGYRVVPSNTTVGLGLCTQSGPVNLCLDTSHDLPPRTEPVDVQAEKGRLAALRARRADMVATSQRAMEACRGIS